MCDNQHFWPKYFFTYNKWINSVLNLNALKDQNHNNNQPNSTYLSSRASCGPRVPRPRRARRCRWPSCRPWRECRRWSRALRPPWPRRPPARSRSGGGPPQPRGGPRRCTAPSATRSAGTATAGTGPASPAHGCGYGRTDCRGVECPSSKSFFLCGVYK